MRSPHRKTDRLASTKLGQKLGAANRRRTGVLMGMIALLALAPALTLAAPAQATELDAITGATINAGDPTAPITVWQRFTVDASWQAPAGARAGDTFSLSFPGPVIGFESTFQLRDSADVAVGDCVVSATSFDCTLNSYVETHHDVSGTLFFYAQAAETSTSGSFVFTTGGGLPITVNIPGGGIGVGEPGTAPTEPVKWGWQNTDGTSLSWQIFVPAEYLMSKDGEPVVLTDSYDSRLTLNADSFRASWFTAANWNSPDYHALSAGTGPESYSLNSSPQTHSFTIVVNEPVVDTGRMYAFSYTMQLPPGAANGDIFTNSLTANEREVQSWPVEFAQAGGNGGGVLNPEAPTPTPTPEVPGTVAPPVTAPGNTAPPAQVPAPQPVQPANAAATPSILASTGSNPAPLAGGVLMLLLIGAVLLGVSKRRARDS